MIEKSKTQTPTLSYGVYVVIFLHIDTWLKGITSTKLSIKLNKLNTTQ